MNEYSGFTEDLKGLAEIDKLWIKYDVKKKKALDKNQSKLFLSEVQKLIEPSRAQNYKPENFDDIFELFDEDKDKFLQVGEMATLIKKVFK